MDVPQMSAVPPPRPPPRPLPPQNSLQQTEPNQVRQVHRGFDYQQVQTNIQSTTPRPDSRQSLLTSTQLARLRLSDQDKRESTICFTRSNDSKLELSTETDQSHSTNNQKFSSAITKQLLSLGDDFDFSDPLNYTLTDTYIPPLDNNLYHSRNASHISQAFISTSESGSSRSATTSPTLPSALTDPPAGEEPTGFSELSLNRLPQEQHVSNDRQETRVDSQVTVRDSRTDSNVTEARTTSDETKPRIYGHAKRASIVIDKTQTKNLSKFKGIDPSLAKINDIYKQKNEVTFTKEEEEFAQYFKTGGVIDNKSIKPVSSSTTDESRAGSKKTTIANAPHLSHLREKFVESRSNTEPPFHVDDIDYPSNQTEVEEESHKEDEGQEDDAEENKDRIQESDVDGTYFTSLMGNTRFRTQHTQIMFKNNSPEFGSKIWVDKYKEINSVINSNRIKHLNKDALEYRLKQDLDPVIEGKNMEENLSNKLIQMRAYNTRPVIESIARALSIMQLNKQHEMTLKILEQERKEQEQEELLLRLQQKVSRSPVPKAISPENGRTFSRESQSITARREYFARQNSSKTNLLMRSLSAVAGKYLPEQFRSNSDENFDMEMRRRGLGFTKGEFISSSKAGDTEGFLKEYDEYLKNTPERKYDPYLDGDDKFKLYARTNYLLNDMYENANYGLKYAERAVEER